MILFTEVRNTADPSSILSVRSNVSPDIAEQVNLPAPSPALGMLGRSGQEQADLHTMMGGDKGYTEQSWKVCSTDETLGKPFPTRYRIGTQKAGKFLKIFSVIHKA